MALKTFLIKFILDYGAIKFSAYLLQKNLGFQKLHKR